MVSPSSRRRAAKGVVEEGLGNAAQACRALGLARSSYYLGSTQRPSSEQLQRKIVELSEQIRVMATVGSRRCCDVKAGGSIRSECNGFAGKRGCRSASASGECDAWERVAPNAFERSIAIRFGVGICSMTTLNKGAVCAF